MPIIRVESLDDPRLAPYRELKDRELARGGDLFIAEGEYVVRRLIESDYPTDSILLAERRADEIAPLAPANVPVYVIGNEDIYRIVGFKFHSGVIACGRRKTAVGLDEVLPKMDRLTLAICPETNNAENLGSIVRISAAFGVDALILGEQCCDPFWRQAIRVSMGTIFRLPLVRSIDLRRDLQRLRNEWKVELAATVLDDRAESLRNTQRGPRLGLLFGNESQGLDREWIDVCDRRITIPMRLGTDSLNVAVAAGIFLHHFSVDE